MHVLVEKNDVPVTVTPDGDEWTLASAPSRVRVSPTPTLAEVAPGACAEIVTVPLRRIAHARSGDKGNDANRGVIARRPEPALVIVEHVTAARVAEMLRTVAEGDVRRWALPGGHAIASEPTGSTCCRKNRMRDVVPVPPQSIPSRDDQHRARTAAERLSSGTLSRQAV